MGRALYDEFGEDAFTAWDNWSQGYANYNAAAAKAVWKSCKKPGKGGKPVTIATVLYLAKEGGFKWRSEHQAKFSNEELERANAAREARRAAALAEEAILEAKAAETAKAIWAAAEPATTHPYLTRKGIEPHGTRFAPVWVKQWVDRDTGEIREIRHRDALLVPIWLGPGKLASLQAIFPKPTIGPRDDKRDKDYLTDGRKHGGYFAIGAITRETATVIVCEGFATGASLHQATGHPVLAAFDASNLAAVSASIRAKLPAVRLVLAADNDQFTRPHTNGKARNPGLEAAREAAKACGGLVALPVFADLEGQPTDFNDLHLREGLEAVRLAIDNAGAKPPPPPAPPAPPPALAPAPAAENAAAAPPPPDEDDEEEDSLAHNSQFAILGYNRKTYYIFQFGKRQVVDITKGDLSDTGLIELAPLNWWEMHFPGDKSARIDTKSAANFVIRAAEQRGIFDIEKIRGRGAWIDKDPKTGVDRTIYHHGDHLSVDGVYTDVTKLKSKYVYELAKTLPTPHETALTDAEGKDLLKMLRMFRWAKPGSAALFAGWVALASVCGTLPWRPHVWLTGGAGSGKSTIAKIGHSLLKGIDVFAQGDSTEPGIRQSLQSDALPVIMDESESTEENDAKRIQSVLNLIRQASTESDAKTLKGTADGSGMSFHIRSMFCLASIQVALKNKADIDRLTVLSLLSKDVNGAPEVGWETIRDEVYRIVQHDPTVPRRLLRRSIDLLPTTLKNITVFSDAAAERFGSQRDGDQYGTLLAGAWSLCSTELATRDQAMRMIDAYDWSEHREGSDSDDSRNARGALLGALVRIPGGIDVSVYELVCAAANRPSNILDLTPEKAGGILERHGMRVKDDMVCLSNTSQELPKLFDGTTFKTGWRGLLQRLPGADNNDGRTLRFNGENTKCTRIPLLPIINGPIENGEPPF